MRLAKYFCLIALIVLLLPLNASAAGDWFRESKAIAWTYYGEDTREIGIEFQYEVSGVDLFPAFFTELGFSPTAIVGDVIYETNPAGETGNVIWSRVTAYYDNMFDVEGLEGRAIYNDFSQGSFLGSGIGYRPVGNMWLGGFYLEGGDWMVRSEGAYRVNPMWVAFGRVEYYFDNERWEGEAGFEYDRTVYITLENRNDEWIGKLGAAWPLD